MEKTKQAFEELIKVSKRLRKECPWDAEQTLETFPRYLVEEAIEADNAAKMKDFEELKEELGDIFWNIMFMANIAEERGLFNIADIMETSRKKMIRRHPHVFGDASKDMDAIHEKWKEIKEKEIKEKERLKTNEITRSENK